MKRHRDLDLSAKAFDNMERNYHDKWKKYEALYKSKHSKEFIKNAKKLERSHLFIPIAKSTIDILDSIFGEAFFGAGNPIEITKNEDKEAPIASILNVLVPYYYKKSKPYIALNMAFSSGSRFGLGAVLPYWCNSRELPITRFIPATKIAFDTEALTRDELQFVAYRFKQTYQDVAEKVKGKKSKRFYDKITPRDLDKLLGSKYEEEENRYKRVQITEVYSVKENGEYICRTFIKDKLVREADFKKLPIKHGFLVYVLPTVDESLQDDQCAGVGESVLDVIKELVKELNQKRNQIIDINEQIIDPYTMVGDEADIDPDDAGRIKGVVNVGDPSKVVRFPPSSSFAIEKEVALLSQDIDDATAINGMQRGQTSSSDRRAAAAMAMINANSSARLSKMATTINDTMFNDWAEAFVRDIYINVPDNVVLELCGVDGLSVLGKKGERKEVDYLVNVKFGQSIDREAKISELSMVLQMLNGREDADVMPILMEILKLILGEGFDGKTVFTRVLGYGGDATSSKGVRGETEALAGVSYDEATGVSDRGIIPFGAGQGDINDASGNQSAAAQNKI
ncbi:MAG: hypothetical protein AB7D34_01250 [Sulfurimonas sp.]